MLYAPPYCAKPFERSRQLRMAAFWAAFSISIVMVLVVAYSISVNKLSKPPSVVRIGADNRLVAGLKRR